MEELKKKSEELKKLLGEFEMLMLQKAKEGECELERVGIFIGDAATFERALTWFTDAQ